MAKKATKTTNSLSETGAAAARKAVEPRGKKHLKAQASGVAAAVEGFVQAIVSPTGAAPKRVEEPEEVETTEMAAETQSAEELGAPEQSVAAPAMQLAPSHEEISKLAYIFYLNRGGQNGSPAEDWMRAEYELKSKTAH